MSNHGAMTRAAANTPRVLGLELNKRSLIVIKREARGNPA